MEQLDLSSKEPWGRQPRWKLRFTEATVRVPLYDGAGLPHTVSIAGMEISLNSTWPGFGSVPMMLLLRDQLSVSDFQTFGARPRLTQFIGSVLWNSA